MCSGRASVLKQFQLCFCQTLDWVRSEGGSCKTQAVNVTCEACFLVPVGSWHLRLQHPLTLLALYLNHQPFIPCFLCQPLVWCEGPFPPATEGRPPQHTGLLTAQDPGPQTCFLT